MPLSPTDPGFPHGQDRGYTAGCRLACCRQAHSAAARRGRRQRAQARFGVLGPTTMVASAPVLQRLAALRGSMTFRQIEAASGLSRNTLLRLQRDRPAKVRHATALALQRVDPAAPPPRFWRSEERFLFMSWTLAALGWPIEWQVRQVGWGGPSTRSWGSRRRSGKVGAPLFEAMERLYAEYENRPGPSAVSAARAEAAGWHVPGCYDEQGRLIPGSWRTDDDLERHREVLEQARERRAAVGALADRGLSSQEIAARLGQEADVVRKDREAWMRRRQRAGATQRARAS